MMCNCYTNVIYDSPGGRGFNEPFDRRIAPSSIDRPYRDDMYERGIYSYERGYRQGYADGYRRGSHCCRRIPYCCGRGYGDFF